MLFTIPNNGDNKEPMQICIMKNEQLKMNNEKRSFENTQRKTFMRKRIAKNEQRKTNIRPLSTKNIQQKTLMRFRMMKNTQRKTIIQKPPTKNLQQKTFMPIRMEFVFGPTNSMKNAGHIHRRTYAAPGITTDDSSLKTTVYSSGRVISGPLP